MIRYEIVCTRNFLDIGLMINSFNGIPTQILARPYDGCEREYGGVESVKWYKTGKFTTRSEWNKIAAERYGIDLVDYFGLGKTNFDILPVKTNADKIRSMSDEELADLINNANDYFNCDICKYKTPTWGKTGCSGEGCKFYILDWLKEKAN